MENGIYVTHGDTIYSFTEHQSAQNPEWVPVKQIFQSALNGNGWSTKFAPDSGGYDITWNWTTPDGLEEYSNLVAPTSRQADARSYTRWNEMSRVTEKGELEPFYGVLGNTPPNYSDEGAPKRGGKPAKTATVKYFVRDNQDQAEAEGHYELTIHEPVELVGSKTLVRRFNVVSPAYTPDPNQNGVWDLLAVLNGDATHTYAPGNISVTVTHGAAKATGWSAGFTGGLDLGIEGILGYNHSEESSWSKDTSFTANLPFSVGDGEAAYLEILFPYQRVLQSFRRFNEHGELRRSDSPPVPATSIPYYKVWDELESQPTYGWHKVVRGDLVPGPKTELPVFSAPPIEGDT